MYVGVVSLGDTEFVCMYPPTIFWCQHDDGETGQATKTGRRAQIKDMTTGKVMGEPCMRSKSRRGAKLAGNRTRCKNPFRVI